MRRLRRFMRSDCGFGVIGTTFGFLVFLTLLAFAVNLLFHLHVTSVVAGATTDAATMAASGTAAGRAAAESHLLQLGIGPDAISWDGTDDEFVHLRVSVEHGTFLPALAGVAGLDRVDRTVVVRKERFR